jgi:hypothetical protein
MGMSLAAGEGLGEGMELERVEVSGYVNKRDLSPFTIL